MLNIILIKCIHILHAWAMYLRAPIRTMHKIMYNEAVQSCSHRFSQNIEPGVDDGANYNSQVFYHELQSLKIHSNWWTCGYAVMQCFNFEPCGNAVVVWLCKTSKLHVTNS